MEGGDPVKPSPEILEAMVRAVEEQPEPTRSLLREMLQWLQRSQRQIDEVKDMLTKRKP